MTDTPARPRRPLAAAALLLAGALAGSANAQSAPPPAASQTEPAGSQTGYADLADLVLAAPVIADATIRSTARIKGPEAVGLPPGLVRFYVEADVMALVRGPQGLPSRIGYLLDVAPDAGGRLPNFKKARVMLFARPVAGSPDQLQLAGPQAQKSWSPELDARVRTIVRAAIAPDAPPVITGIGHAFYVPGALPGEGETQVFLTTADGRPVSLSVLRRPGERPRWAVALSEIVDEAAAPPAPDTLLWYRLACTLPATLPDHSTATLAPADAESARADYRFVIDALGPCGRTTAG